MTKATLARVIAGISITIGILVIIGWHLNITILTSILPQWIRMKYATAACFILSGFVVYFVSLQKQTAQVMRRIVLTFFPILIVGIMGSLLMGSLFGFQTGLENIRYIDVHEIQNLIFQGRPSVATMICFFLIAFAGLLSNFSERTKNAFLIIGSLVGGIGAIGVLGYIVRMPYLYYEIPGVSNAIALHTTLLFALLGAAIALIGKEQNA